MISRETLLELKTERNKQLLRQASCIDEKTGFIINGMVDEFQDSTRAAETLNSVIIYLENVGNFEQE